MNLVTIIGIVASIGTAMSMVPQLAKLIKEKKAENISLYTLFVLFLSVSCWVVYGILKNDWIIIISNSFSFIINVLLTVLAIKYKNKV